MKERRKEDAATCLEISSIGGRVFGVSVLNSQDVLLLHASVKTTEYVDS